MKVIVSLLLSFLLISCGESDLVKISNDERLIKFTDVYDCRDQGRHPWGDSPHSVVIVHLIDFSNKTKILHRGYYKNSILETPYDYEIKTTTDDNHQFEQWFFDLTNINESNNFITFSTRNEKGKKTSYVINKRKNQLVFDKDLPEEWDETVSRLNLSEDWLKKNTGLGWTKDCKKI